MDPAQVLDRIDRDEYPWTPRSCQVDRQGHQMAFLDEGKGDPVLMLHGNPTWSYLYRHFVHGLSDVARCIVPDMVGFGCSDKPRDPTYHTLERHIRNVTSLVRQEELDGVTLVCQDWGGPVGLGWAVRNPHKVKRLVLLNTWAMRPDGLMSLPRMFKIMRSLGLGEIIIQKHNMMIEKLMPMGFGDKGLADESLLEAYRAPFPFPDDRVAVLRFTRMVPDRIGDDGYEMMGEIEAGLPELDVPVQAYWGRKDPAFRYAVAERLMELLPQGDSSSIVPLPSAGHFVQEEAHAQIVPGIRTFMGA